ncbi:hypothetical protein ACG2DA_21525, partial [Alienimonas sp. DA493]
TSPGPLPHGRGSLAGAVLTGVLFGLSALCRPTVWAFGGLWALGWIWDRLRGRAGWRLGWGRLALGAVGVTLIVGPWAVRNWVVFDRPIVMTTHGGYTLHLANNAAFYEEVVRGPAGAVWEGESLERWQRRMEADRSSEFFTAGAGPIDDPGAGPDAAEVRAMLEAGPRGMSPGTSISPTVHAWTGAPDLTRLVIAGGVNEVLDDRETFITREAERGRFWRHSHSRIDDDGGYRSFLVRVPPPEDGPAADRWHRDRAIETIQSDPGGFARAVPLRVSRLWSPVPQGPAAEGLPGPVWWAVGGWNVVVFLLAAAGAVRAWRSDRWAAWRPVLLMVVSVTAVHAVYWSNARMRGPIVPAIAVLAAAGACGVRRPGDAATTETERPSEVESFGGEGKS